MICVDCCDCPICRRSPNSSIYISNDQFSLQVLYKRAKANISNVWSGTMITMNRMLTKWLLKISHTLSSMRKWYLLQTEVRLCSREPNNQLRGCKFLICSSIAGGAPTSHSLPVMPSSPALPLEIQQYILALATRNRHSAAENLRVSTRTYPWWASCDATSHQCASTDWFNVTGWKEYFIKGLRFIIKRR
jgi:hypothetical protein